MRTLTIEAASQESARALHDALSGFGADIVDDDGWRVVVPLGDGNTVAVLSAIEQHVISRGSGPALIRMDGKRYTLAPRLA